MPRWYTNSEALLGLAMLVVGLAFFVSSTGIEVLEQGGIGPRVFPMGGSLLLAGLGLLQLAERARKAVKDDSPPVSFRSLRWRRFQLPISLPLPIWAILSVRPLPHQRFSGFSAYARLPGWSWRPSCVQPPTT